MMNGKNILMDWEFDLRMVLCSNPFRTICHAKWGIYKYRLTRTPLAPANPELYLVSAGVEKSDVEEAAQMAIDHRVPKYAAVVGWLNALPNKEQNLEDKDVA